MAVPSVPHVPAAPVPEARASARRGVRGRVGRAWPVLLLLASAAGPAGCAASGGVPAPFPQPGRGGGAARGGPLAASGGIAAGAAAAEAAASAGPLAGAVVGTALRLQGVPYRNGGADTSGFDCSGFVEYVFAQQGLRVPRTVGEQFLLGRPVDPPDVLPGDLVFFTTVAPGASHVGIAISRGEFVHAPSSRGVVRVETLWSPYWAGRYVGARRLRRGSASP